MSSLYKVWVENPYLSFLPYEPITPNPCYRLQIHGKVLERWRHLIKLRIIIYIFVVLLDIKKVFVFLVPPVDISSTYRRVPFFWQKSSDKVELRSCWSHVDGMQSKPHTLPSTNHRSAVFELISQWNSDVSIFLNTDWSALLPDVKIPGYFSKKSDILCSWVLVGSSVCISSSRTSMYD